MFLNVCGKSKLRLLELGLKQLLGLFYQLACLILARNSHAHLHWIHDWGLVLGWRHRSYHLTFGLLHLMHEEVIGRVLGLIERWVVCSKCNQLWWGWSLRFLLLLFIQFLELLFQCFILLPNELKLIAQRSNLLNQCLEVSSLGIAAC
jgi:hypothetical protein